MTDNYDIIKDFLTPTEIVVEESGPTRSKIVLEPLEQGFGHTLGNALEKNYIIFYAWNCCFRSKN